MTETPLEPTTPVRPPELARDRARARRRSQLRLRRRALALVALLGALAALVVCVLLIATPVRHLFTGDTPRQGILADAALQARKARSTSTAKPTKPITINAGAVTYAAPARLIIPAIGIDAAVETVGLTADGAMAAPSGPATVGWYSSGAKPGNSGSAVLDGHSGYANDRAAVFDTLPKLKVGARIYIIDAKGHAVAFAVQSKHLYAADAQAPEVFASATSAHLNLITCTGAWDSTAGTHSQRLVVFAVKEKPHGGTSAN